MSDDAKNIIDSLNFCYGYSGIYLSEYKINRTINLIPNSIPKHKKDEILNTLNKYRDDYVKGADYDLLKDTIKKIMDA